MAIASRSVQCLQHFEHLAKEAQHSEAESKLPASAVVDELGRFTIWASSVGASQKDSRSLDYRLRDASQIRDLVTKSLQDLKLSLGECTWIPGSKPSRTTELTSDPGIDVVSGKRPQKQGNLSDEEAFDDNFSDTSDSSGFNDSSSSGSEKIFVSELSQLFLAVTEAITSLNKPSTSIRNATNRDGYVEAASSNPV